jgi:hypothetical protein
MRQSLSRNLLVAVSIAVAGCMLATVAPAAGEIGLRLPTGYEQQAAPAPANPQPGAPAPVATWRPVEYNDVTPANIPPGVYDNVWGVFVGISKYKAISNLSNADKDAIVLAATMRDKAGLKDPIVLTNEGATVDNLQEALAAIGRRAGPNDLMVFHFSGHGIGFQEISTGRRNGFMLMHEAVMDQGVMTGQRRGMIDMSLIDKMMDDAGIDTKHKLILLDCCFGGLGASVSTRSVAKGIQEERAFAAQRLLGKPAVFVMSAGDGGQEVLDISVDFEGHGLLTGFMIQALQNPGDFADYGLRPVTVTNRTLLNASELFLATQTLLPNRAYRSLDAIFSNFQSQVLPGKRPMSLEDAARQRDRFKTTLPADVRDSVDEIFRLYDQLQTPQQLLRAGSGMVFVPVVNVPAAPTQAPTPIVTQAIPTPQPTAVPTQVPTAVPPGKTPAPTQRPVGTPAREVDRWKPWCDMVSKHWNAPDYGPKLFKLFEHIYEKDPPRSGQESEIMVSAEVLARPIVTTETWSRIERAERWNLNYNNPCKVFTNRESWRQRFGLSWEPLPYRGATLSENYEYSFRIANSGRERLFYYLIAVDQAGTVQWVAPENETWVDGGDNYSSGRSPLTPQDALYQFPPLDPVTCASAGQPVVGTMDQYFFMVVTRERWMELEEALRAASARSFDLYRTNPAAANTPVGAQTQSVPIKTRAVGKVSYEKIQPTAQNGQLDTMARTKSNFLIFMWKIDIVPPAEKQPALAGG